MNEETANKSAANSDANAPANRKEYMRELMRKKRTEERLKREQEKDQTGEVSLVSVGKELVVQTGLGDSDGVTPEERMKSLTDTDKQFEAATPGYWIYGKEVKERKCWQCGKPYETRLELNKFCGPECKEKWLSDAFGKLKGVAK